jgi:hypothetical protein
MTAISFTDSGLARATADKEASALTFAAEASDSDNEFPILDSAINTSALVVNYTIICRPKSI